MSCFDAFIEQAWNDHTGDTADVVQRLSEAPLRVTASSQIAPLVRLIVHVFGEHLGRWHDGESLLAALGQLPQAQDEQAASALRVGSAALGLAQGRPATALQPEERIAALACATAIALGRGDLANATTWFMKAMDLAATAPPVPRRGLAVAANNLACTLISLSERTHEQRRTMLAAAQAALVEWQRAGTWVETERAQYTLAKCHLQLGDVPAARRHATQCLDICEREAANAFEMFFAHEVLACVARDEGNHAAFAVSVAQVQRQFDALPADDQAACRNDLESLRLRPSAGPTLSPNS